MKKIIFYLIILILSIWIGVKIFHNPGYVLVTNQKWVVETTLWFAALVSLLSFLLLYFLTRLIINTVHLPVFLQKWQMKRRHRKSRNFLYRGTDDFLQGKWKEAEKFFLKSARKTNSLPGYLGAAEAAYTRQSFNRGNFYLAKAKKLCPNMAFSINLALAKLQIQQGLFQQALTNLLKLYGEHPKHRYLLELISTCYIHLNDWDSLYKFLPAMQKAHVYDEGKLRKLEQGIYIHLLKQPSNDFSTIENIWKKLPKYLKQDPEILLFYSRHLKEFQHHDEAEKLLRHYLKKNWSEPLFAQYVELTPSQTAIQIAFAEECIKSNPNSALALQAMGMLCFKNQLWGQAKDYLERSLKIEKSKHNYILLGFVLEKMGDHESALNNYRKSL